MNLIPFYFLGLGTGSPSSSKSNLLPLYIVGPLLLVVTVVGVIFLVVYVRRKRNLPQPEEKMYVLQNKPQNDKRLERKICT